MAIKEEELKEFMSYLDIDLESVESLDSLKTSFSTEFARKEVYKQELAKDNSFINPLIGKRLGSIETKLKQSAKDELGLEFDAGDFKDKGIEDILDLVTKKAKVKIEESKVGANPDIKIIEDKYKAQLHTYKEEVDNYKNQLGTVATEFETFKTNLVVEAKQRKLNDSIETTFGGIKFAPEADELRKEGFRSKVMNQVKFDFDDEGKFSIFDKEGKTLFNPKKNGVPYSPEEYLKDQAIEHKIFQLNTDGGRKVEAPTRMQPDNPVPPTRFIHPSANL